MKKQVFNWVVAAAIFAGVVGILWRAFGSDIQVATLVDDLLEQRNPREAARKLKDLNDRGLVLKALKEALDEEDGTVGGKKEVLDALSLLKENRPVRRALESPSLSTRRAAAFSLYGDPELRSRIAPVAVAWLKDEKADRRDWAVFLCDRLDLPEAVPVLLSIVETAGKRPEDAQLLQRALGALSGLDVEGLGPKMFALAGNPDLDPLIRGSAFEAVGRLEDAPRDGVQELMIETLTDAGANIILRHKATSVLQRKRYADEKAVAALEKVLFDPKEADWPGGGTRERDEHRVIQRQCLSALAQIVPLDRLRELLLDRRIYKHPYFGVRTDVAAGCASLRLQGRVPFDILCEYLVDDDPHDRTHLVRQEAWLTLWTLTGITYGVEKPELFLKPPKPIQDDDIVRRYVFATHQQRPGVSAEQVGVVSELVKNLDEMKKMRQTFQGQWEAIKQRWDAANQPPPDKPSKPEKPEKKEEKPSEPEDDGR